MLGIKLKTDDFQNRPPHKIYFAKCGGADGVLVERYRSNEMEDGQISFSRWYPMSEVLKIEYGTLSISDKGKPVPNIQYEQEIKEAREAEARAALDEIKRKEDQEKERRLREEEKIKALKTQVANTVTVPEPAKGRGRPPKQANG